MQPRARIRTSPVASPLVPPARLKRLLNDLDGRCHRLPRTASRLAGAIVHRAGGRDLHNKRIYRRPIDDALRKSHAASQAEALKRP